MTTAAMNLSCEYQIPTSETPLHEAISRWSDSRVERPAIVVFPNSEEDIVSAIKYAKAKGLRAVPAGGAHGTFTPIDKETLYLDLKNFKNVSLDKEAGVVHVGGGTVVSDVSKVICPEGYYTLWANNNAVGMVGCVLGGGAVSPCLVEPSLVFQYLSLSRPAYTACMA
jgi:FAD/FMN-containing dehydrogenase